MREVPLYEATIRAAANKAVKTVPKRFREEARKRVYSLLETHRDLSIQSGWDLQTTRHGETIGHFDPRQYRANLDAYIERISAYVESIASSEDPLKALNILGKNLDLMSTGQFGLELKIGSFAVSSIEQLSQQIERVRKEVEPQGRRAKQQIESMRAEAQRRYEKRMNAIEEVMEKTRKFQSRNPYAHKPNHPSEDSP